MTPANAPEDHVRWLRQRLRRAILARRFHRMAVAALVVAVPAGLFTGHHFIRHHRWHNLWIWWDHHPEATHGGGKPAPPKDEIRKGIQEEHEKAERWSIATMVSLVVGVASLVILMFIRVPPRWFFRELAEELRDPCA